MVIKFYSCYNHFEYLEKHVVDNINMWTWKSWFLSATRPGLIAPCEEKLIFDLRDTIGNDIL